MSFVWRTKLLLAIGLVMIAASCSTSETSSTEPDGPNAVTSVDSWGTLFEAAGVTGTFSLREVGSTNTMVWNADRASEPRRPASTFKILNSLIVLETGVLPDTETSVPWDGIGRNVPEWNQNHNLRSGIEVSAVWAYQELARQVGNERMQEWVTKADYGNTNIAGGIDEFWLRGDLRISPIEQLDFLEAFATGDLPFDGDVMDAVADILIRERGENWTWSHKTGTALVEDPDLGWLVGLTTHEAQTFVFAMNLDLETSGNLGGQIDPQLRQDIAREILISEGALPESALG